ncbi:hypothetical protein D9619_009231 [Psilocybe cf. subviscida]|uniref:Uncharacterized protein n=1 Tax=Psilocybe cf. subviscida TaxID=2480587 RepID=A0A8H5FAK1_9AGAR|nr:hypothetical protein D9619_009231 [Psilocybe cf. subviscida]
MGLTAGNSRYPWVGGLQQLTEAHRSHLMQKRHLNGPDARLICPPSTPPCTRWSSARINKSTNWNEVLIASDGPINTNIGARNLAARASEPPPSLLHSQLTGNTEPLACRVLEHNLLDSEAEGFFDEQNVVYGVITVDDLVGHGGSASSPYIPLQPQSRVDAPFESTFHPNLSARVNCALAHRRSQHVSHITPIVGAYIAPRSMVERSSERRNENGARPIRKFVSRNPLLARNAVQNILVRLKPLARGLESKSSAECQMPRGNSTYRSSNLVSDDDILTAEWKYSAWTVSRYAGKSRSIRVSGTRAITDMNGGPRPTPPRRSGITSRELHASLRVILCYRGGIKNARELIIETFGMNDREFMRHYGVGVLDPSGRSCEETKFAFQVKTSLVTHGVPRLKEIIGVAMNIETLSFIVNLNLEVDSDTTIIPNNSIQDHAFLKTRGEEVEAKIHLQSA